MCFSATASFVSGALLCLLGVVTLSMAPRKRDLMFAAVPLFFGIQQLFEGAVWLGLRHGGDGFTTFATYGFTFFSHVLWPVWIPAAVLLQEPFRRRKIVLRVLLGVGAAMSLIYATILWTHGVSATIVGHSIAYEVYFPLTWRGTTLYIVASAGSCLVSSRRWIVAFGVAMVIGAVLAFIFFLHTFPSVWCFVAALVSVLVYVHFRNLKPWPTESVATPQP